MNRRGLLLAGPALLAAPLRAETALPPGRPPDYVERTLSEVPNAAAIGRRYWAPALNAGYVPQGLCVLGGQVLVAAYRSRLRERNTGPSRVFRLDREGGAVLGSFPLPPEFGHPGGLDTDGRMLFVADSGRLLALDATRLEEWRSPPILAHRRVDPALGPSFLGCDGASLWFGAHRRDGAPRLVSVPVSRIMDGRDDTIGAADARYDLPLPLHAQGAAVDREGRLWVSASSGNQMGRLFRLDPRSGAILGDHAMPGGIEDIGGAPDGMLWAVSEAGSERWSSWNTFFPLVFEIDPAKLR
ncbi:hypothetical protein [Roseomonas sp. BN140053]|uniref:hypothetical protein n=1 Tax=Roseomonas sp. BN140053 TaxID=3391898 RepID=UPI0039E8C5F1